MIADSYADLVYIMAIPLFSFFLPLYSFWQMDDFRYVVRLRRLEVSLISCHSWGATRVLAGGNGKVILVHVRGSYAQASKTQLIRFA